MKKKVNPYEKKTKKRLRITRKQWITILSVLGVIAILAGIIVMAGLVDPHAGHDHAPGEGHGHTTTADDHAGHDHGTTTTANPKAKVTYNVVTNADNTYIVTVRDEKGAPLFTKNNLLGQPIKNEVDKEKGIYQLAWVTSTLENSTANTYEALYYNELTGQVSDVFYAPKACDGTRVAYPSADQTKIIVQDLFDKKAYYKEHPLEDAVRKNGEIVSSDYKITEDKKSAIITYFIAEGKTKTVKIPLHE